MGYFQHRAFLCIGWKKEEVELVYDLFRERMRGYISTRHPILTPIMTSPVNAYYSFAVMPDGSKEGWRTSDVTDEITKWVIEDIEEERINVHYVWTTIYDEAGPPRIIASDEERHER